MGRPRKFDEATAVAAAAAVFRQRGYTATSVDHLVDATGVHRGSLYGVFGSKHGLFLRVLDQAAAEPARERRVDDDLDLVLVALLELAPTDEHVRARVAAVIEAYALTAEQLGDRLVTRARLHPQS